MRTMRKKRLIQAAIILLLGVAVYFCVRPCLESLYRSNNVCRRTISSTAVNNYGLKFYSSLDYPILFDETTGGRFESHFLKYKKGKFGGARKFEKGYKGKIILNHSWNNIMSENQTLSFFFKPDKNEIPQTILSIPSLSGADNVLAIENDIISLKFYTAAGCKVASGSLLKKNKWNHVALRVHDKVVGFYLNGILVGEIPLDDETISVRSWIVFGGKEELPYLGSLDEIAIFSEVASEDFIKKLGKNLSISPLSKNTYHKTYVTRIASNLYSLLSSGARVVSILDPSKSFCALNSHDLPIVSFNFSKSDDKHFKIAHEDSILTGKRISPAANMRKITMAINHDVVQCYAYLDDIYGDLYIKPKRPGYVVIVPENIDSEIIVPKRMFTLTPPELYAVKHPDADYFLPSNYSSLVRFYTNNELKGIYYLEEWQSNGRGWMVSSDDCNIPRMLSASHSGEPTFGINPELAEHTILSDIYFPWSKIEVDVRSKQHEKNRKEKNYAGGGLHEFDFLADNISPFMLRSSLIIPEGIKVVASSNPELIDLQGNVFADKVNEPSYVNIIVEKESTHEEKELKFRVVPESPDLPTLSLWIDRPLQKTTKQDFLCSIQMPNQTNSILNFGLAGKRSGIMHRGNTSYVRGRKRSLGLEFEFSHNIIGDDESRHLVLVSGYADKTRLRNAFTFEMFKKMNPDVNYAPNLTFVEACVNGEYAGIYEAINRIDDLNLPSNIVSALRVRRYSNLFGTENFNMFEEIVPRNNFGVGVSNYLNTVSFLKTSTLEDFRSHLHEKIVMENIVDYYLMFNFTQNIDIVNVNQVLCYDDKGRLSIVPWDCDKSFNNRKRFTMLGNRLYNKCLKDSPEFKAMVKERWQQHKTTIFSDEAIDGWIADKTSQISKYMDYELKYISTPLDGEEDLSYEESVEDFRKTIYFMREKLDEYVKNL